MESRSPLVTGIIAGAAIGAVAGLLLAPKPGKVTRRFVKSRARRTTGRYIGTLRQKFVRDRAMIDSSNDNLIVAG